MTYSPSHGLYVSQGNDILYMPDALKKIIIISFQNLFE